MLRLVRWIHQELVEKGWQLRAARAALHPAFVSSPIDFLFCFYNACITLHHDPARSDPSLCIDTMEAETRFAAYIYITWCPGFWASRESVHYWRYTLFCTFEHHFIERAFLSVRFVLDNISLACLTTYTLFCTSEHQSIDPALLSNTFVLDNIDFLYVMAFRLIHTYQTTTPACMRSEIWISAVLMSLLRSL